MLKDGYKQMEVQEFQLLVRILALAINQLLTVSFGFQRSCQLQAVLRMNTPK